MSDTSSAMEPQERFVLEHYRHARGLCFVDAGANDGVVINNTIHLERDYGWTGLCVEPNPDAFERLAENRRVACRRCGLYSRDDVLTFLKVDGYSEMLSGFEAAYDPRHRARLDREVFERGQRVERIEIPARRLDGLLDELRIATVHYLAIDTEGSELDILRGADLPRRDVRLISVEDNFDSGACNSHLLEHGYRFLTRIGFDDFWERGPA
jgi:FkbM family methyltransferase